jgi:hypothetical protein
MGYVVQRSAVALRCHCGKLLATLWVADEPHGVVEYAGWHWEQAPRCDHRPPLPDDATTASYIKRFRRTGKAFKTQVPKPV